MQLCAITDRRCLPDSGVPQRLLDLAENWSAGGVQFIQLREKDLAAQELQSLAREMMERIDRKRTKLLVNISAPEWAWLAAAAGADGVHLAGRPSPGAAACVRQAFRSSGLSDGLDAFISVPCHCLQDIDVAGNEQVDLMLFSPVFEKPSRRPETFFPQGLEGLRRACQAANGVPVLALGGAIAANAQDCVAVGAAGVAGIRLFLGDDWRRLAWENDI
jgi:thiamine-phosphate pyrophosphorylase